MTTEKSCQKAATDDLVKIAKSEKLSWFDAGVGGHLLWCHAVQELTKRGIRLPHIQYADNS